MTRSGAGTDAGGLGRTFGDPTAAKAGPAPRIPVRTTPSRFRDAAGARKGDRSRLYQ
jgi:hypothetical protein